MQTIGSLLKSKRLDNNLSLEDISKETNIASHLLKFLEEDDFKNLPSSTFTKGFITKYADMVGISSQKALAIFRRDFIVLETGKIMPRGLAKPLDKSTVVTSKIFSLAGLSLSILLLLSYLFFQIKNYKKAPEIEILRPKPNSVVIGPIISVKGFATADSTIYVNNAIADIFPTGEFRTSIELEEGNQQIVIKAIDSNQKTTEIVVPVTVVDK